jgi:phage tail-like protein
MAELRPFLGFGFVIEIMRAGEANPLVGGSFAECDGLEMTQDVKTIRDGADQARMFRSPGAISYANLSLKRGMTSDFGLWTWFTDAIADPFLRADAEVVMLAPDGGELARFLLSRCLPVKLKAPSLSATNSGVAIEELQIAYETLTLKPGKAA